MKVINFAETNSVLNQYVAEIRDVAVQGDRMRFRRNIERIGEIMAYEMSKELTYSVKQVQTPLGVASVSTPDDEVVIATVFRAGLPLHTGFLNMFDHAGNAFVSAYRYYKDKECRTVDVHIEYIATPDLSKKTLLIVDPMLATGESMELAWKAFVTKGMPAKLQIACVIASRQGVEHLEKLFPGDEVTLWCAAIDPEMNEHSYIVPGTCFYSYYISFSQLQFVAVLIIPFAGILELNFNHFLFLGVAGNISQPVVGVQLLILSSAAFATQTAASVL